MGDETHIHEEVGFLKGQLSQIDSRLGRHEESSRRGFEALNDMLKTMGRQLDQLTAVQNQDKGRSLTWRHICAHAVTLLAAVVAGHWK